MYNYQSALRGDGLAAPVPAETQRGTSSEGTVEAYKRENESLKDMIDTITKENGSNGILEGKYLAHIKKCKTLTVQLESEKTRTRQLQKDLDAALAKMGQDDDADKDKTAPARPRKKGKDGGAAGGLSGEPANGESAATPSPAAELKSLKERLDRAFQQVRSRDVQLEETKRENTQLRLLVRQEIGDLDSKDVDALLKRTGSVLTVGGGGGETSSAGPASAATGGAGGGAGWRGRAEQIALLKAKVKDLERTLTQTQAALHHAATAAAAASAGQPELEDRIRDDGTSYAAFSLADTGGAAAGGRFDETDVSCWLSLAQRTGGGAGGVGTVLGSTSAVPASVVSGGKDFEEVERKHLADMSNQKLLRIRELEQQVETSGHQLAEEKRKQTALQARYQTLQRQHTQLRAHVETMLEKSATDDELIAAYKEEMEAAQHAARAMEADLAQYHEFEWQQQGAGNSNSSAGGGRGGTTAQQSAEHATARAQAQEKAVPQAASSSISHGAPGGEDLAQLRQLLQFYKTESTTLRQQLAAAKEARPRLPPGASDAAESSALMRRLNDWWAQALASPPVVAALRHAATTTTTTTTTTTATTASTTTSESGLIAAVMAALLTAHRCVLAAEATSAALVEGPSGTLLEVLEQCEALAQKLAQSLAAAHAAPSAPLTRDLLASLLDGLGVITGGATAPAQAKLSQLELAKKENAHLRERTRVLTEMLEKERVALSVVHKEELRQLASAIAPLDKDDDDDDDDRHHQGEEPAASAGRGATVGASGSADMADQYAALQVQYNDLRTAFNQMQSQNMKRA